MSRKELSRELPQPRSPNHTIQDPTLHPAFMLALQGQKLIKSAFPFSSLSVSLLVTIRVNSHKEICRIGCLQAFLYGEGDFKKTVGISIAAGFDCDNQAATLAGLLGVMHGGSAIPKDLTHQIAGNDWAEPFNNKYVNQRRPPLDPVYTNSEIIDKVMILTGRAILEAGGQDLGDAYQMKVPRFIS